MKKAIVVGASSGIGRELAKILVQNGYRVGITARRKELLESLATEKTDSYVVKAFDLLETETVQSELDNLKTELGGLDLVVVCAGISKSNLELDSNIELKTNLVNVVGYTLVLDWAFNLFREQKHGHLVGLSSVAAFRGWRNNPAYGASKAYENIYLEGLRNLASYLKLPVTVTTILPGYVETAMKGHSLVFWVATPQKAAQQIYKDIKRKRKVTYTYRRWRFVAFLYRRTPNILIEKF